MGSGHYSDQEYYSRQKQRRQQGVDDFHYSKTNSTVHATLDPRRIKDKPLRKLESRDNPDHPKSNAVVFTCDVTGSNIENARIVQKKLPLLMGLLGKYLTDVQVAIAANDDIYAVGEKCVQISEFESDIRIDESIRNLLLTGNGGGNDGESYELMLYGIAYRTILDCYEKRNRKGYCFIYADEPLRLTIRREDVKRIYGEDIERDIPFLEMLRELAKQYNVFVMWPALSSYHHAYEQYKATFGRDRVFVLESPDLICEFMATVVGMNEAKLSRDAAITDLVAHGANRHNATLLVDSLVETPLLAAGD